MTADQIARLASELCRTQANVFEVAARITGMSEPTAYGDALTGGVFRCWTCGWWLPHEDAAEAEPVRRFEGSWDRDLWYCHGCGKRSRWR